MPGQLVIRSVKQAIRFVENSSPGSIGIRPRAAVSLIDEVGQWFSDAGYFPGVDLVRWLGISSRTFARRRRAGLLGYTEAERLLRLVRLKLQADHVLGSSGGRALRWMVSANRALGGVSPMNAAVTEIGAALVSTLLLQLQEGIAV